VSNIPQNTVDSSRKNTNHNIRVVLLILIILAVLSGVFFAFLLAKNRHQSNQLLTVQNNMQQALDNEKQLQDEHLETMAREIRQLRQDQKDDISKQLQDQYDQIVQRLETLSKSDNGSVSTVANDLLAQLSNQAGDGIGISGPNNTTITNKGVITINNKSGDVSLQGVPNQTTVTQNGNTIAVGTAQDISQTSNPTFNNQTLTGNQTVQGSVAAGGLNIGSTGTQNGYQICDSSNNCGYSGAGYSFVQGGNSYGAPANLGTNDNNPLHIRTNGSTRITVDGSGNTNFTGDVSSGGIISGNGSGLTNINAGSLSGGTVADSRLSSNVTIQGNTFNGANQLVQLTAGGLLPALDGSNLQNVDASSLGGQSAGYYTNASNIANGTLGDSRLSSNVALKNSTNTFTGTNNFAGITATGILQNGYQVCDASNNCNYATSSGSGSYIWNGTSLQIANFNIQSASSSSVGAIIQGASGQTAHLQEWRDSLGGAMIFITPDGALQGGYNTNIRTGYGGSIRFAGPAENLVGAISQDGRTYFRSTSNSVSAFQVQNAASTSILQVDTVNSRVGIGNSTPGNQLSVGNLTTGDSSGRIAVATGSTSNKGIIVQGTLGQVANLQEWQNSAGTTLLSVAADGSINAPSSLYLMQGNGGNTRIGNATQYLSHMNGQLNVRSTDSSSFIQFMTSQAGGDGFKLVGSSAPNGDMVISSSRNFFQQDTFERLRIVHGGTSGGALQIRATPTQTADIQQWLGPSGTVLARVDAGGNLTVKNASVEGAYITFSNNIRGYNVAVSASATSQTVSFGTAHSDANYAVFCTPDWNTTCYVTNKTVNGFTLNYGTPAPAGQLVDWFVAR
jgi:hypothetical protein